MSFQVYVQVFRNGEAAGMSLDAIRDAFKGHLVEIEDDYWQARYGDDEASDLFLNPLPRDSTLIHSLSIDRPCRDDRLHDAIWELLAVEGAVFHVPGGKAALVRDPRAGDAMPGDLRSALGAPVMIRNAQDIARSIEDAQ